MSRKFFIRTFGCQMNDYDSRQMAALLAQDGAHPAECAEDADIIIFNTCSVRERAQEKVFSDLGRVRRLKEENPELLVGVGGCVASQEGEEIIRRAPFVDVVFGPQTLHRLAHLLQRRRATGAAQVDIAFPEVEKFDHLPPPRADGPAAYVSIMEGCSKYCTFCVVPYTRGEEVSRPLQGVLTEVARLAAAGCREVTLLGQNVNAYRVQDGSGGVADFADLLAAVCAIPGIARVRFTTSHPVEFTERLIAAYAELPQLPDYLHLPVQSGSDRILAQMKRGYTALEYKSIIRRLRRVRPRILVSSDFIIGFPGEEERDFAQTMQLVQDVGFDFSYSFLYSRRPGTPAASLPDHTPPQEKKRRLAALQQVLDENGRRHSAQMVGNVEQVLVTGRAKRGGARQWQGRTANTRVVNFRSEEDFTGKMLPLRITEAMPHTLRGEVAGGAH